MLRDGAIIFSDLIGKLDILRIECAKCGRSGRYRLADLITRYATRPANSCRALWRRPQNARGVQSRAGETIPFVLSYGLSFESPPASIDAFKVLQETEKLWRNWSDRCPDVGPWTEAVKRSLITLKALTYAPSGGMVAAVTTSLPEHLGGVRNWDYRYCWLRDATFTLQAFMHLGYYDEARAWRDWILRAVAGSPEQIQIMYGVGGERWLPELPIPERGRALRPIVLAYLARAWRQPDEGIWEIRGEPQHFVHSKVMAWVAFDRAADMAIALRNVRF